MPLNIKYLIYTFLIHGTHAGNSVSKSSVLSPGHKNMLPIISIINFDHSYESMTISGISGIEKQSLGGFL